MDTFTKTNVAAATTDKCQNLKMQKICHPRGVAGQSTRRFIDEVIKMLKIVEATGEPTAAS